MGRLLDIFRAKGKKNKQRKGKHIRSQSVDFDSKEEDNKIPSIEEILQKPGADEFKKSNSNLLTTSLPSSSNLKNNEEILSEPIDEDSIPNIYENDSGAGGRPENLLNRTFKRRSLISFFKRDIDCMDVNMSETDQLSPDVFEMSNSFDPDQYSVQQRSLKAMTASHLRMIEIDSSKKFCGDEDFLVLISSRVGYTAFRSFLKKEFSQENIDFWGEVVNFRQYFAGNQDKNEIRREAFKIYHHFISLTGSRSININSATKKQIDSILMDETATVTKDLFKAAEREIYRLMLCSSFSRFRTQPQYMNVLAKAVAECTSTRSSENFLMYSVPAEEEETETVN